MPQKHKSEPEKTKNPATQAPSAPIAIPCAQIFPAAGNPPRPSSAIDAMVSSIRSQGLLSPVIVRPHPTRKGKYELVAGECRWRAMSQLSKTIPAFVRDYTDQEADDARLTENMQRQDLSDLQLADQISRLVNSGRTIADISDRLAKPAAWVARRANLVNLSKNVRKRVERLQANGHHCPTANLEVVSRLTHEQQDALFEHSGDDRMLCIDTAADVQRTIEQRYMVQLSTALWKLDAELGPDLPPCSTCQTRSSQNPNLFNDMSADTCLNIACWEQKQASWLTAKADQLRAKHGEVVLTTEWINSIPASGPMAELLRAAVPNHRLLKVQKSASGAIPALVVMGDKTGQVYYVLRPQAQEQKRSRGRPPAPQTLELKREALQQKRMEAYRQTAARYLAEIAAGKWSPEFPPLTVMALAIAHGAQADTDGDPARHVVDAIIQGTSQTAADKLLRAVCRRIDMAGFDKPDIDQLLVTLQTPDPGSLWARVCLDIPEPRAWARMDDKSHEPLEQAPEDANNTTPEPAPETTTETE